MRMVTYARVALVAVTCGLGCVNSAQRTFEDPVTHIGLSVWAAAWPDSVDIQVQLTDPARTASIAGVALRSPDGTAQTPRRLRVEIEDRRSRRRQAGGMGYGRQSGEAVPGRRGGWDQPRATELDRSERFPTRTHGLSDATLLSRARLTHGIERVRALVPVHAGSWSPAGYAVGVLVLVGAERMPLAVVLPLDAGEPVHKLTRLINSPTELALEMELSYVSRQPAPSGPTRSRAEPGPGGSD